MITSPIDFDLSLIAVREITLNFIAFGSLSSFSHLFFHLNPSEFQERPCNILPLVLLIQFSLLQFSFDKHFLLHLVLERKDASSHANAECNHVEPNFEPDQTNQDFAYLQLLLRLNDVPSQKNDKPADDK